MIKNKKIKFWSFATSQLLANLGDGMGIIIITLLASRLTDSPGLLGAVVAALGLPWFLLSLFVGPVIDNKGAYYCIKYANLARAIVFSIFLILTAFNYLNIPILMALAFLIGAFEVLSENSFSVMLPEIVDSKSLEKANSITTTAEIVANNFLGVNLGALLLGLSVTIALGVSSLFYLLPVLLLIMTFGWNRKELLKKGDRVKEKNIGNSNRELLKNYFKEIISGFNF